MTDTMDIIIYIAIIILASDEFLILCRLELGYNNFIVE